MKIFGCPAFAHISDTKRKKLDPKAKKAIFVGYGDAHGYKAYRLYDPHTNTFFFSRSVLFDEDTILQQHKCSTTLPPTIENNQHSQEVVTQWRLQLEEPYSHDMHQTLTDPTPSSVSFTLTPPSHHPFFDAEYSSTHSGTTFKPSHSPTFSPLHQENNYDYGN